LCRQVAGQEIDEESATMPTYDYVCRACDHQFELFQSITANPVRKCPECGRLKLRRLIGPGAAIVFKGSGFYTTDYRSASYKKGADAEGKASANGSGGKTGADSKGKSESKAASGTD
jgi:putative FmdB family regulatory protein